MRLWSKSVPTCVEAESTNGRNVRKFMTALASAMLNDLELPPDDDVYEATGEESLGIE